MCDVLMSSLGSLDEATKIDNQRESPMLNSLSDLFSDCEDDNNVFQDSNEALSTAKDCEREPLQLSQGFDEWNLSERNLCSSKRIHSMNLFDPASNLFDIGEYMPVPMEKSGEEIKSPCRSKALRRRQKGVPRARRLSLSNAPVDGIEGENTGEIVEPRKRSRNRQARMEESAWRSLPNLGFERSNDDHHHLLESDCEKRLLTFTTGAPRKPQRTATQYSLEKEHESEWEGRDLVCFSVSRNISDLSGGTFISLSRPTYIKRGFSDDTISSLSFLGTEEETKEESKEESDGGECLHFRFQVSSIGASAQGSSPSFTNRRPAYVDIEPTVSTSAEKLNSRMRTLRRGRRMPCRKRSDPVREKLSTDNQEEKARVSAEQHAKHHRSLSGIVAEGARSLEQDPAPTRPCRQKSLDR